MYKYLIKGMYLREFKKKDAPYMLEWMHDENIVCFFKKDFSKYCMSDCEKFIVGHKNDTINKHFAIIRENDEYCGTVSLKNCNLPTGHAEFAIVVRTKYQGTGVASQAMQEMIKWGKQHGINTIYWNVYKKNTRAQRFYEKNGYKRMKCRPFFLEADNPDDDVFWYSV